MEGSIVVKAGVIALCVLLALIAVFAGYAFINPATESETENRTLSAAPDYTVAAWLDHDFDTDFDAFLSDHVALRNELIQITFTIEEWMRRPSKIRFIDFQ
jgi:hypothetical protein